MEENRIVVELNEEILPKEQYATTYLKEGDCMEIVMFMGGGGF
jgi:sulfur carrier protein